MSLAFVFAYMIITSSLVVAQEKPLRNPSGATRVQSEQLGLIQVDTNRESGASPKVVRYAQHLLDKYDLNHDGRLQRNEWQLLNGHPELIDQNGDGEISAAELARWIADYGHRKRIGVPTGIVPTDATPVVSNPDSTSDETSATKSSVLDPTAGGGRRRDLKFFVPARRLPPGLPDWFVSRDLDGDGQLTAGEFSPTGVAAELSEFSNYDANGDGILTAKECVRKSLGKSSGQTKDPNP